MGRPRRNPDEEKSCHFPKLRNSQYETGEFSFRFWGFLIDKTHTAGKKRFLRFSEACDYYNLGLVHIRRLAREADAIYRIYGAPQLIEREKLDQYMQELRQS